MLLDTIEKSFYHYDIYVDEKNGSDASGNGAKNAPYGSIAKAVAKAKELIATVAMPSIDILLMGGFYELSETVMLDGDELGAKHYRVRFKGCEGAKKTTVSGTFSVDGSAFSLYDK